MPKYITQVAVLIKGDQVPKGTEVELDEATAANMANDVRPADAVADEPEPEATPDKPLEEMTVAELKAKAEELELPTSGTKADLIERITLHQEGGADEPEEEEDLPADNKN